MKMQEEQVARFSDTHTFEYLLTVFRWTKAHLDYAFPTDFSLKMMEATREARNVSVGHLYYAAHEYLAPFTLPQTASLVQEMVELSSELFQIFLHDRWGGLEYIASAEGIEVSRELLEFQ